MMDIFLELLIEGGPYAALIGLVLYAIYYLIMYVKKIQEESRNDIKEMQRQYREDIGELLDDAKQEREESRTSIENMSANTTKAIDELNKTVTDLTLTVSKMETLIEFKLKK